MPDAESACLLGVCLLASTLTAGALLPALRAAAAAAAGKGKGAAAATSSRSTVFSNCSALSSLRSCAVSFTACTHTQKRRRARRVSPNVFHPSPTRGGLVPQRERA